MNSNDWVAEHVMGFERGNCRSATSRSSSGSDGTFETWFSCDWCRRVVYNGKTGPCPKYPFPKFTLVDLMRKLGERGYYGKICYTAARHYDFTIVLGGHHMYANDPLQAVCDYLYSNRDRLFPEAREEVEPAFFANIRDAIKLLQKAVGQAEGK